jgi:hypothetical protein
VADTTIVSAVRIFMEAGTAMMILEEDMKAEMATKAGTEIIAGVIAKHNPGTEAGTMHRIITGIKYQS